MSDLSEKQWQEYLAKEERDVLWRAYFSLRSAEASCTVTHQPDLREKCEKLDVEIEERLRVLYETANGKGPSNEEVHPQE